MPLRAALVPLLAAALLVGRGAPALAQTDALGSTTFPNSGAAAAQEPFLRGVLLLHSFEYQPAREAFRRAQRADPDFALAYWGEAMTWNQPVWFRQDREEGRAALERLAPAREARRVKAGTERERLYLDAVEILFGDGAKPRRDTLYLEAMRALHERFPDDENAAAFYALAILGTSHGGRHVPTYLRAAAVADDVFRRNPRHPGAAHYLIHAYDDPINAPKGLAAARAYSGIAPDAPHAQHMTTHIFVALGMWDDVVSQNTVAADATAWTPGHYTSWLGYGLIQQGRYADARAHLERARERMGVRPPAGQRAYLVEMRGDLVVGTERWDEPSLGWTLETGDLPATIRAEDAFVQAFAALRRGDRAAAERGREVITRAAASATGDSATRLVPRILEAELRGLLALDAGHADEALALLGEATRLEDAMPFEFGPPAVVKPSHELLGEALLAVGRPEDARRAFARALELTPKRALALRGLARAAAEAGDGEAAARAYRALREIWHAADPERPELVEAQAFLRRET